MTDYQEFTDKSTSAKKREQIGVGNIYSNKVRCIKCGETIRSKDRHDFVTCSCKTTSVDGGSWYLRRVGGPYEELSEYYDEML